MLKLPYHPHTLSQVDAFVRMPSHALILSGPKGIGKLTLATSISETLLDLDNQPNQAVYLKVIRPEDEKAISIDIVRELEHFLSLKVPNKNRINRILIIDNSQLLSVQAQNALLKTVEEPPRRNRTDFYCRSFARITTRNSLQSPAYRNRKTRDFSSRCFF